MFVFTSSFLKINVSTLSELFASCGSLELISCLVELVGSFHEFCAVPSLSLH